MNSQSYRLLYHLHYASNYSLNNTLNKFLNDVNRIANSPNPKSLPQPVLSNMISLANNYLLSQLDEAVHIHQTESEYRLQRLKVIQWAILFVVLFTLFIEAVFLFRPIIIRLVSFTEELLRLATHDGLTQLYNQSYFIDRAHTEAARTKRSKQPLTLMMFDIDYFKKTNDTYGHSVDDHVLRSFSERLSHLIRPMDACGRIGGEEFTIILPDTKIEEATLIAERICQYTSEHPIPIGEENEVIITVSIGISEFIKDIDTTMQAADKALYKAKRSGRNCVNMFSHTNN